MAMTGKTMLVSFATVAAVFFGGGGIGLGLAAWLSPGSAVASFLSFLMLPAALIVGFHVWLGLAILFVLPHVLRRLARHEAPALERRPVPPGASAFVVVSSAFGLFGGLVAGVLSTRSTLIVAAAYWVVATAYGYIVWRLAEGGHLPFPESD